MVNDIYFVIGKLKKLKNNEEKTITPLSDHIKQPTPSN
jgi:hypothetical protein